MTGGRLTSTARPHPRRGVLRRTSSSCRSPGCCSCRTRTTCCSCRPTPGSASALLKVRLVLGIVASLAVVFVIAARWRSASRPLRRALLPSLWGALCGVLYAASLTSLLVGSPDRRAQLAPERGPGHGPGCVGLGPAALPARARRARGPLPRARHAARRAARGGARQGARRSRASCWRTGCRASAPTSTAADSRVELPAPGGDRAAAPVERDGRELGDARLRPVARRRSGARRGRRGRGRDHARRRAAAGGVPGAARRAARLARAPRRRRATRSGGGSSATSTTGRSSGWCPWRSSCA